MLRKVKTKIGKTKQQSAIQNVATKRLLKDLMEINKSPLKGINAAPVSEKNLFVWHCNMRGPEGTPYEGGIFHVVLNFPQDYPQKPPTLQLCTRIEHPNVFGSTICLDMLQQTDSAEKYSGWSSAYTVQSILVQLQAFLFEADVSRVLANIQDPKTYEQKKKEWLSAVKWSVEQSRIYSDKTVGHNPPHKPWPAFPEDMEEYKHLFSEKKEAAKSEDMEALAAKSDLVCFFTRGTFEEDVLGYGISYSKNLRTGAIKSIQSPLDLISLRAYMNHGLRTSSYNEKFTHFLPIYINPKHGEKAMYLAERALSIICTGSSKNFKPEQVLEVLPKLMATMTVEVMSQRKHASIKALRGYCHFYRLLLEFVKKYPQLLEIVNKTVKGFIENDEERHKDKVPNLGEFLALLPVSDYSWSDVRDAYIQESFTRNVFWLLNKYEELEKDSSDEFTEDDRLQYSFETTKVGQKLLMFNVFFLEKVSRPNDCKTRDEVSRIFDNLYGRPPMQYEDLFIQTIDKINKVENYLDAFKEYAPNKQYTKEDILQILKESVKRSKDKGYHGSSLSVLSPEEFAKQTKQVELSSLLVKVGDEMVLETNEEKWKERCFQRWGINEVPSYLVGVENQWRKLYLQNNLQDVIGNLNDATDFKYFHETLDHSIEIPHLDIQMFNPEKLTSKYFFLTCILTKLKNLDTLVISRGEDGLGVKGFRALIKGLANNPGQLSSLILDSCDINSQSIQELTKGRLVSSNLKRIVLTGNPIGDDGADFLGQFLRKHENLPHLSHLDLSRCNIGERGAKAIAEALLVKKELKSLNFVGNPVYNGLKEIFQNLSYSTAIETVDCSKISGSLDNGESSLGKLLDLSLSLKKLNLWKTTGVSNLSQVVFNRLGKSQTLKELDLAETGFKNVKFLAAALKDNTTLEDLNLFGNYITCTEMLALHDELICLYNKQNSGKKFTKKESESEDQANQPPPQLINLKRLILSTNSFESYPANKLKFPRVIGEIIKMSPRLVYLDLSKTNINREHMESIAEALTPKFAIPLKTLLLKNNNLGKYGLKPMVAALQANTTLETLDISGNEIGVVGCDFLSQIMKENKGIRTLNMFSCFVQIEGAELLSAALQHNTTLTNLDLGLNRIKVRGALAFVKLLQVNTTLKRIGLKHNHINDKAGLALATAITKDNVQSSVTYLALAGNYLSTPKRSDISLLLNSVKDRTIEFDLAKLVDVKDPEKQERTVYVTPLPGIVTTQQVKRLFYQNRCGVILNVSILQHKVPENFQSQKYAFVEFAHPDSVQLAMRLQHQGKNVINNVKVRIAKAGIQQKEEESFKKGPSKKIPAPPTERRVPRAFGGRGGRGGRGGARRR